MTLKVLGTGLFKPRKFVQELNMCHFWRQGGREGGRESSIRLLFFYLAPLLLPLIANIYKIIPTHKLSVFIYSQIFSKSKYPYLNVRKRFPKVIIRTFRVRRKFFRVRPCLVQATRMVES